MTYEITREQELEVVNTAYALERSLNEMREDLNVLESSKPRKPSLPNKPVMKLLTVKETPLPQIPKPDVPFPEEWRKKRNACLIAAPIIFVFGVLFGGTLLGIVPAVFITYGGAGAALYCSSRCRKKGEAFREAEANRIMNELLNSQEYIQARKDVETQNHERVERAKLESGQQYAKALQRYESIEMPAYEKAMIAFEKDLLEWETSREELKDVIATTESTLKEIYDRNILPGKYRNLEAVTFIASFMGTSYYDLEFAIERFDKEIDQILSKEQIHHLDILSQEAEAQLLLMQQILSEQQYSNYLTLQSNQILANSNDVLKQTRNWTAANAAMHAYDIKKERKREKTVRK